MMDGDTLETADGRGYVLDENGQPIGVEDEAAGVSRPPVPGEVAHDFPHMPGHGTSPVYDDAGNLVGTEDYDQNMSVPFASD